MINYEEKFLPYGRQEITESDIRAVKEVLRSPYLTQGPATVEFERKVAGKVGAKFGVAVNSATSALHIACLALGLGKSDILWTSPITFVASANCGKYCGAKVDFVDIDPSTGLMSVDSLKKKLKAAMQSGNLPKIVVPVHLSGSSCDMKAIGKLSKRYGFSILEDASHAIGGKYRGRPVGNCRYSSITVFSFHPVKIITCGEGGLATTNDPDLAQSMIELRSHGIVRDQKRFELPPDGPWSYEQQRLGFNYRMTDIQAALGLSQLERLDEIISERNRLLKVYKKMLKGTTAELIEIPKNVDSSVHLAIILLKGKSKETHKKLFRKARKEGIGVQLHYSPIHLQPYYRKLGFTDGNFPEAERYGQRAMSIPLFPGLRRKDQRRVMECLL